MIGYGRLSTQDQNPDGQRDALAAAEHALMSERTMDGLAAARARGMYEEKGPDGAPGVHRRAGRRGVRRLPALDLPSPPAERYHGLVIGAEVFAERGHEVCWHFDVDRQVLGTLVGRTPSACCVSYIGTSNRLRIVQTTLVSQIPLTLSCPHHGCRLEPTFDSLGTFFA